MSGDFFSHACHAPGRIDEDQHILGTRRRLDVPTPRTTVEEIWIVWIATVRSPINGRILPHETRRTAEVLPGQRWIETIIVFEGVIELLGPAYGTQHLLGFAVDGRRHVHGGIAEVDVTAKVLAVVGRYMCVVLSVLVFVLVVYRLAQCLGRRGREGRQLRHVHNAL